MVYSLPVNPGIDNHPRDSFPDYIQDNIKVFVNTEALIPVSIYYLISFLISKGFQSIQSAFKISSYFLFFFGRSVFTRALKFFEV